MIPDISEISAFEYWWDFDQNEYEEYIQNNNLKKTQKTLFEYIKDNVTFEMEFFNDHSYHAFATDMMTYTEISDEFGDKLANRIVSDCIRKNTGRCESKEIFESQKKKTVIITEEEEQKLIGNILNEVFYPTANKVLRVTKFLDDNFERYAIDSIDDNGYPTKENTVVWMTRERQPIKTLKTLTPYIQDDELIRVLDDQSNIRKMISNEKDRKKFLRQVVKDWYFKRRGIENGILSVNHL